jgi:hypothetical protein
MISRQERRSAVHRMAGSSTLERCDRRWALHLGDARAPSGGRARVHIAISGAPWPESPPVPTSGLLRVEWRTASDRSHMRRPCRSQFREQAWSTARESRGGDGQGSMQVWGRVGLGRTAVRAGQENPLTEARAGHVSRRLRTVILPEGSRVKPEHSLAPTGLRCTPSGSTSRAGCSPLRIERTAGTAPSSRSRRP